MYSYEWDNQTGGFLLNSTPLPFSKEPRPVYYKELDILGFDRYWNYAKNDSYPYMWAETNNYYYRGKLVAKTMGGSTYTAPEIVLIETPEPGGQPLRFVDIPAMVEKNQDIMEKLSQDTIKRIYNTFVEYQKMVDVFYVAFSGGKDSIVTFDLVKKTLPHNSFKVLFGDTGMEFPDTYNTVDVVEGICKGCSIDFMRAKSEYSPDYTWSKFGPPATVTRWCCSVHKTAPQVLALRKATGKPNFTGMAFIGVRASESPARSEYDYVSLGEKHKGQYNCNPILDWNSAELYLYIYTEKLYLNEAYKKGNRRAGCLVCPGAVERNEFLARSWYTEEFDKLISSIRSLYSDSFSSPKALEEFISIGGWKARKNGRDISIDLNYKETCDKINGYIQIQSPRTDWKEWIKTIGVLQNSQSPYHILFRGVVHEFEVDEGIDEIEVSYSNALLREAPLFIKLLKNVFRKAACCIRCRECEADCHNGCIYMDEGILRISDNCLHCFNCHKVEKGCLVYKSLAMPKGGLSMSATKSLNCYSHHAPKMDWFKQYFNYKNDFDQKHTLGSQMYSFFKRFLRDAQLLDDSGFSPFAHTIDGLGLDNNSAWALMLVNLSYTPQINWLVKRVPMGESYGKEFTTSLLVNDGAKESWVNDVWSSFARILDLPFAYVGLGQPEKKNDKLIAIYRTPWENPDPKVILYSLYKFAEACGNFYQFSLTRLLNHDIDSDGVSPTEIFCLDRNKMEKILNGLTFSYPEYIDASFSLGLDNITLLSDKKSEDILNLF
jgi:phosphoadenosine phosphosulfate reductase